MTSEFRQMMQWRKAERYPPRSHTFPFLGGGFESRWPGKKRIK